MAKIFCADCDDSVCFCDIKILRDELLQEITSMKWLMDEMRMDINNNDIMIDDLFREAFRTEP